MALTHNQQLVETIKRSNRPIITIPTGAGPDGYASGIGLAKILEKLDKSAEIVAVDGTTPKNLHFLKGHDKVRGGFGNLRKFVISLDVKKSPVDEFSYDIKDDKLNIFLSPKKGFWSDKDIKLKSSEFKYDLIISIGAPDFESFNKLYKENSEFFYYTPVINIDHSSANEHFGELNHVDLTASSCGEVIYNLINEIEPGLIDEEVATAMLTGMIHKTKSFKTTNVTPKTLHTASRLVASGARRDEVVHHLYRTRSIQTLKLWGRALARLQGDADKNIVWSLLSQQDFKMSGADEECLSDVIHELISNSPQAKVAVLLYEDSDKNIVGIVNAERPYDAVELTAAFKPSGTREQTQIYFLDKNLVEVEKEVIPKLKEQIAQLAK